MEQVSGKIAEGQGRRWDDDDDDDDNDDDDRGIWHNMVQ